MTTPTLGNAAVSGAPASGSRSWHALDPAAVEAALATGGEGLSTAEVVARQAQYGPNELAEEPPPSVAVVLARQFRSPLIFILLLAAGVTVLLAEYLDAAVIGVVLLLNAVIGAVQERKAEGAVRALTQLVVPHARVVREGQEWDVTSRELVPGDVVLLESGTRVPADLRLVRAKALQIDESLLTGESVPVFKRTQRTDEHAPLADRTSMAFTGSVVSTGRGRGIVVATGTGTELGHIAGLIRQERATQTPLQLRMAHFAKVVGIAVAVAATVAFVTGVALGGRTEEMFLTAVALAVSAVPEGLPVAVTITLAIGVSRMARRRAVIRRLPAVETLGSTTVIGSDKTGTLTENRMSVRQIWTAGRRYERRTGSERGFLLDGVPVDLTGHAQLHATLVAGVMANEAEAYRTTDGVQTTGDPTEAALLMAALDAGLELQAVREGCPELADIPFEPKHRYAASVRDCEDASTMFVKGAPERLADMCTHTLTDEGRRPFDADEVHRVAREMAGRGLRVLAMASRRLPAQWDPAGGPPEPAGMTFLGLQGLVDPPRAGVKDAIAACHRAGIRVVMITGDHAITARSIATDLGITTADARVVTGAQLAGIDDAALGEAVLDVTVYARVSPEDKLRIVHALQGQGEVVAVTGDGVNDAPALKAAAIGVAMGQGGTDVAREAADMVLADDNFITITSAVEQGRVTFDNIRKVTFFLVSTGAAEVVAILVGLWLRWPLLLLPAQLLWLNLVTNGLQDVALAFEPGDRGVLRRRPRARDEGILSRIMWERTVVAGLVMAAGTLAMFRYELAQSGSLVLAQTAALTTLVVFQVFQAGNARSETESVLRRSPFSNPFLFLATLAAVTLHVAALYLPPTQYVLRIAPLPADAWLRIVAVAVSILGAMELHKWARRPRP